MIKAAVFLRASDYTLLQMTTFEKGIDSNAENDLELIIRQIQNNNPRADERNKLQTALGSWFYKLDENRVCYLGLVIQIKQAIVLTSHSYPEKQAFAMIKEMEREIKKIEDYSKIVPKEISKHIKLFIKDLSEKYNNLTSIDKVAQAQNQVNQIQANMEQNIKKMLENNAMIDGLDQKADTMAIKAKEFSNNANELAKLMYWRNVKLKIIILIIVLAILLYITVPLIITATQKKDSNSQPNNGTTTTTTLANNSTQPNNPPINNSKYPPPNQPTEPNNPVNPINPDGNKKNPDANTVDKNETSSNSNTISPDTNTISPDTNTSPPDTNTTPPDTKNTPPDTNKTPTDTNTTPPDTNTVPPDTNKLNENP